MSETDITAIENLDPISGSGNLDGGRTELSTLASEGIQEVIAAGNLSVALEGAMSGVLTMPGTGGEVLSFKDHLMGAPSDEITREKVGMMSGESGATPADQKQEQQDALLARYEQLYTDMTVFQVAWSIARRVQQDTSQLLRGQ
jgi:hypothetical protein